MKKIVGIISLVLFLAAQPVLASKSSNSNGNGKQNQENHGSVQSAQVRQDHNSQEEQQSKNDNTISPIEPSISPSPTVSPDQDSESHVGSPVSQEDSSEETCDSNAQWKNHGAYVSCVAHTHPGGQVVSDAARSDIGKKHNTAPSVTPSPTNTPTPSPITSPLSTASSGFSPLASLSALLGKVFGFLKHLL